jgi:hypothetical protein
MTENNVCFPDIDKHDFEVTNIMHEELYLAYLQITGDDIDLLLLLL